jgi:hypothetical protein
MRAINSADYIAEADGDLSPKIAQKNPIRGTVDAVNIYIKIGKALIRSDLRRQLRSGI